MQWPRYRDPEAAATRQGQVLPPKGKDNLVESEDEESPKRRRRRKKSGAVVHSADAASAIVDYHQSIQPHKMELMALKKEALRVKFEFYKVKNTKNAEAENI